jgi:hypothetical protein
MLQQVDVPDHADDVCPEELMAAVSEKAFTLQAVAIVLQVPFERAQKWLDSGEMKGYHLGGQWYVSWPDFEAFLESPTYDTARHDRSN